VAKENTSTDILEMDRDERVRLTARDRIFVEKAIAMRGYADADAVVAAGLKSLRRDLTLDEGGRVVLEIGDRIPNPDGRPPMPTLRTRDYTGDDPARSLSALVWLRKQFAR